MKDYFKPKTWLITILMFTMALGLSSAVVYYEFGLKKNIKIIRASAADNVTGWAWNANTGWISFNCTSDTPACGASDYGVSVNLGTGHFSGYAWSSSVGWISFNRRTCVGGGEDGKSCAKNNDCSSNSCSLSGPGAAGAPLSAPYDSPASLEYNAIYSFSTNTVTGWAKILSLGNAGWIKFNGDKQNGQPWTPSVTIDPATGEFSGWAWNGGDVGSSAIGWISFNCTNESSACSGTNYKVVGNINRPPAVTNMKAPNWNYLEAAGASGALNAYLDWNFSDQDAGSSEKAYQIKVSTNNDPNNPIFDSGKCVALTPGGKCTVAPGTTDQFPLQLALLADGKTLDYNTAYYWWIKVWDNYDADSGRVQFNTNVSGHILTDNQVGNTAKNPTDPNLTFTTYRHEMPDVNFSWFPFEPSRGEEVQFTDQSKVYSTAEPDINPVSCTDALCDWFWSSPTPGVSINDPATSTPIITFNMANINVVELTVTDVDGYWTKISISVNVNAKMPIWKEVKPQ